ncbi:MAG: ABC transporter permease [Gammaproteobacteria bacterium]|nr:ABC transporter permease [Gammaproteobacteria bacterium]
MRAIKSFGLLRESWVGMIGAGLVFFWVIVALLAPLIAPFEPNAHLQPFARPGTAFAQGGTFWLGTDNTGRDILSRLIWGSRTVLFYAPLAALTAYTVGILMGVAAGYMRGWVDDVLSRVADIILSFPVLVLYIIIIATVGASGLNIIIAITFASAPGVMRIVRGLVLDLRNRDYVAAAQTRGEPAWRIMLVEILPNARGPLIVDACLRLGYVIITIGVLGFLGLGLPPPDPDWGGMVNETRQMAIAFPHMTLFPCIAISSLILGFNLLADGLREISLRD